MKNKIAFSIGVLAIFCLMTVPLAQEAEAATFKCKGLLSGTINQNVKVPKNETCIILSETTINGNLQVRGSLVMLSFGAPIHIEQNVQAMKSGFVEIYAVRDGLITIGQNLHVSEKDNVHVERVTVGENVDFQKTENGSGFAGIYKSIIGKNLKVLENTHAYVMDNEVGENMDILKNGDAVVDGNNIEQNAECKDGPIFAINNIVGDSNNGC